MMRRSAAVGMFLALLVALPESSEALCEYKILYNPVWDDPSNPLEGGR